jgi:hypothetical protein
MKYLCLICAETVMEQMSAVDAKPALRGLHTLHRGHSKERPPRRGQPPEAAPRRDHHPRPAWQDLDHRRAVRRDQGAAGWLLRHRGQESARGDPGGGADPGGVDRVRRDTAHRGGCADAPRPRRDRPACTTIAGGAHRRRSAVRHFPSGVAPRYPCLRQRDGCRRDGCQRDGCQRDGWRKPCARGGSTGSRESASGATGRPRGAIPTGFG